MLRATNRSRHVVDEILLLFPLIDFCRARTIGNYVGSRHTRVESAVKSKTTKWLSLVIRMPITQSVAGGDGGAAIVKHKVARAGALEHILQESFRRSGTIDVLSVDLRHGH